MNKQMDSKKLSELADVFCAWAKALNDYRFERKRQQSINEKDYQILGGQVKQLLNAGEKMKVMSTLLVPKEAAKSLEKLQNISSQIEKSIKGYENIQKVITLTTGLANLGSAIIKKDISGIHNQVQDLLGIWKNEPDSGKTS